MKRVQLYLLTATIFSACIGCQNSAISDDLSESRQHTTIEVTSPDSPISRVAFEETLESDGATSINLSWRTSDLISLYDSAGYKVDDFIYSGSTGESLAQFTALNASTPELIAEESYTAIYPASSAVTLSAVSEDVSTQTQVGDKIEVLNNYCKMSATSTGAAASFNFAHKKALLIAEFTTPGAAIPTELTFIDGSESYTVTFSEMSAALIYKAYIMIDPVEVTSARALSFSVTDESGTTTELYSGSSSSSFKAGKCYASPASMVDNAVAGITTISTPEELLSFKTAANNNMNTTIKRGILLNDIDMSTLENWVPIGTAGKMFAGVLDGNGFKITNFAYNKTSASNIALVGFLAESGVVKNLTISEPSITAGGSTSAIVSQNYGTVYNCHVSGGAINGNGFCAGVTSQNFGLIEGCTNSATVAGKVTPAGGIAGSSGVAATTGDEAIINCHNYGQISCTAINLGGIVGYLYSGYVIACSNNGSVTTPNAKAGGIVGTISGTVIACANRANVESTVKTSNNVGGICGLGEADALEKVCVIASYDTGAISKTADNALAGFGAIAGSSANLGFAACYYIDTLDDAAKIGFVNETQQSPVAKVADADALNSFEIVSALNSAIESYNAGSLTFVASTTPTEFTGRKCNYRFQVDESGYPTTYYK